jgi:flagellar hook-associated protein 1 FlgK
MTAFTDTLVSGSTFTAATGDAVAEYPGADDEYVLRLGDTYLNTDSLESGELHAHLTLRDGGSVSEAGIPYYISQLDELARSVVQAVNECMNTGYTFPDEENGFASVTGVDMFEDFGNAYALVTAGNFTLSAAVTQSVWNIAASDKPIDLTAADTQSANNVVALKLAELIDTNDFSGTLDGMIAHLGVKLKTMEGTLDTHHSLVKSTENQRQSISGVSLDEEAVNLIMYQQTYAACSRMVTTIDEILDKLINDTGIVGR